MQTLQDQELTYFTQGHRTGKGSSGFWTQPKAMAPPLQYSCLENPMDGGAWWAAIHGVLRSRTRLSFWLHFHFSLSCIGEGNGNPLQCSCLENPRDGGARWAAIYGVAQSWTRLKRLSSSSTHTHFPGGSVVKNPSARQEMQETWIWSLGGEDPLEKEMATHSSILAWEISWIE